MNDQTIIPTPERIAKAGDRYEAPAETQQVKRPYARATPSLDFLHMWEHITPEQFQAGDRLRHWLAGAGQPIGLVSSYGQQRWSGTLVSQELGKVTIEWPVYCRDKLIEAERRLNDNRTWRLIMHVIADDYTVEVAGACVCVGKAQAGRLFKRGLQVLADGDIDKIRPKA